MRFVLIVCGVLFLAGCLPPTQDQLRMQKDLEEMKRRLAQIEVKQAEAVTSGTASGETLQRQVAELSAGLDNLRVEFQSINGRLDDLGYSNQQMADEFRLVREDMGLQLDALNSRVDQLEQQTEQLSAELKSAPQAAAAVPEQPQAKAETPEQLYHDALEKIRQQEQFAAGREQLQTFIDKYPQHELYVNALYWIGEALYGEKKYELAILQFQDVISKHAEHPKAAAAMYKQALSFKALGDEQNARTTMQKLLEDYPNSEQAAAAKKFLE